ncbi:MAG: sn-glycerol-3-phosphate ABC transporter ATP-binding protein UgpC [Rhodospirillaceae bacterium]|nr:sn-glycerol-3-phosphate ABC transporter ATP-binding protein UgpC [Rhodospirillaceae bacterium]
MAEIVLDKVSKTYGADVAAVSDVSLTIRDGEFMVLLGPSGCGKSTTLRMIAGLEEITRGDLYIDRRRMNEVDPAQRDLAIVFQNYALYPHMTVAGNLAFGLKLRGVPRAEIEARIRRTAEMLGIGDLLKRRPRELSGGQQQRVALGRALVREPRAFLLDEPLSNLDAKLRAGMRTELIKLHRRLGATIVHVTHDQVEAMTMGERICIMRDGRVVQVGAPLEVYRNPADTFVAGFLASPPMNLLDAALREVGGRLAVRLDGADLPLADGYAAACAPWRDKRVVFGIRPEDVHAAPGPGRLAVDVTVVAVEALGPEIILVAELPGGQEVHGRMGRSFAAPLGSTQRVWLDMAEVHLFDAATTRAIPRPAGRGGGGLSAASAPAP